MAGFNCPHCSKDIPDVVPKERLQAKIERVTELEKRVGEQDALIAAERKKVGEMEPIVKEYGAFKAERETDQAIAEAGLKLPDGADLAAFRRRVRMFHEDAVAELEEGKRPALADWLKADTGGRADPLLRGFYTPPTAGADKGQGAPARGAGSAAPAVNGGGARVDPTRGTVGHAQPPVKMTPEAVMARINSPEFRALSPEQRAAERAAMIEHVKPGA